MPGSAWPSEPGRSRPAPAAPYIPAITLLVTRQGRFPHAPLRRRRGTSGRSSYAKLKESHEISAYLGRGTVVKPFRVTISRVGYQRVRVEPGRGRPGFGLVRCGSGVFDMNSEKGQMAARAGAGSHVKHKPTSNSPASQKRVRMVILPSARGAR